MMFGKLKAQCKDHIYLLATAAEVPLNLVPCPVSHGQRSESSSDASD